MTNNQQAENPVIPSVMGKKDGDGRSQISCYDAFQNTSMMNSPTGAVEEVLHFQDGPFIKELSNTISESSNTSLIKTDLDRPIIAIIPAYNEEIAIGSVVLHTKKYVNSVIVIDDGSIDHTVLIAKAAGAIVISFSENRGKGFAMMKGFEKAREMNPAVVIMLDGDAQHNPAEIPELIKPIIEGNADLVIGSRFLTKTNYIPGYRKIGQKTLNLATKVNSGFASTDSQSGFRAIGRKGLKCLDFKSDGYNFESDMIAHFLQNELVITEVPITVKYDVPNKHKKHPFSHGWDVLSHIIGIIGYKRPLLSFGIPGMALMIIGLLFGSWAFTTYYLTNTLPFGLTILSVIAIIAGLLLITTALILNSLVQIGKIEKGAV